MYLLRSMRKRGGLRSKEGDDLLGIFLYDDQK